MASLLTNSWLKDKIKGHVKLLIAAVQQCSNLHSTDVSLQNLTSSATWVWFGFKMTAEKCLCCFAPVEYILLILLSVRELKCYMRSALCK